MNFVWLRVYSLAQSGGQPSNWMSGRGTLLILYGCECVPWHNPEDNPATGCRGEALF